MVVLHCRGGIEPGKWWWSPASNISAQC